MNAEAPRSIGQIRAFLEENAGRYALLDAIARDAAFGGTSARTDWTRTRGIDARPCLDRGYFLSVLPCIPGDGPGLFEFSEPGAAAARAALVVELRDEADEHCIDLLAVDLNRLREPMTLLGAGQILGLSTAFNPATFAGGRPLRLRRDPASWLADGCRGVVLASAWAACDVLPQVPGDILCEDRTHAREIGAMTAGYLDRARIRFPREPARG